jgi:aspartyl-tRNA(Asn)/glutamyl-tRNA(Gln) amidotransferase subunit B
MRDRMMNAYGLSFADASQLVSDKDLAEFYESTAKESGDPRVSANFILSELTRELNNSAKSVAESPVSATNLAELIKTLATGSINNNQAKEVLVEMFASGGTAAQIIKDKGSSRSRTPVRSKKSLTRSSNRIKIRLRHIAAAMKSSSAFSSGRS